MINRIILIACLFVSMNMQAQNADKRIGSLINESKGKNPVDTNASIAFVTNSFAT